MAFKIDFRNGTAVLWEKKGETQVKRTVDRNYRPRFYIQGSRSDLKKARTMLHRKESVLTTRFEDWYTDLEKDSMEEVLRVDTASEDGLKDAVYSVKSGFPAGRFKFYNVSLSPQFRYCLQQNVDPTPEHELSKMKISIPREALAQNQFKHLKVDGNTVASRNKEAVKELGRRLRQEDPDVIIINRADLLPQVKRFAEKNRISFRWGREKGLEQLAGSNTVSSYGKTLHSSERYNIPGRAIINKSNSFMYGETDLDGLLDLVERSRKPLQELAWGSIGNLLTAIEVRKAYTEEDVLTPWKNWQPEKPKKASQLHKGDRGGFIFNPEPGIHRDVYEVDFASMYPNIMIEKNISPETVCCNCCSNKEVPELDFSICQEKTGFIPEVLEPLVTDRAEMKEEMKEAEGERLEELESKSNAIKWLLVTCFGYMGHAHASFGAIECHQAINAYARKILVESKEIFEEHGWKVKHGIIDSIWVERRTSDATDLDKVCREVSDTVGIELEQEHHFDWLAFVPRKNQNSVSTLNRYFGKTQDGFKTAGIEVEQSSSFQLQKDMQREMLEDLDENDLDFYSALEVLEDYIDLVKDEDVKQGKLVIQKQPTRSYDNYRVNNNTKAAMYEYRKKGVDVQAGEKVEYIVRNHGGSIPEKVRLPGYADRYDTKFYRDKMVSAAVSVLSPLGYSKKDIEMELRDSSKTKIDRFT